MGGVTAKRDYVAFGQGLDDLQGDFFKVVTYYEVWKAIFPTKERVAVLNRYKDVFGPIFSAAREMLLVHFAKLFDPDPRAISLYGLITAAEADLALVPNGTKGDLTELRRRLDSHAPAVKALRQVRNQRLAHLDWKPNSKLPLPKGEFDSLLRDTKHVFNGLQSMYDRSQWEWSLQERHTREATERMLKALGL